MEPRSRLWALTAGLVLAGTLAACGSDSTTSTPSASSSTPSTSSGTPAPTASSGTPAASTSATSTPAGQAATVKTAKSDLGTILVDGEGMTLYLFTGDTQGSGESTCTSECAGAWPPLLGTPKAGAGTDKALLGTLDRGDGTMQVTYNGWPLYSWTQDSEPGDTKGQGLSDAWWVVDPEGDAIGEK